MAFFNKSVITENGLNLLSKAITSEIVIEFVRIVFGSGIYTNSEKTQTALQKVTTLKEEKQECYFSSKSVVNDNRVSLKALLSNENLTAGYYINEIGIYAKVQGESDESAVLYSIAVAEIADYMPEYNGSSPVQIIQEYHTTVNNASSIVIVTQNGVVALAEDLNKHVADEERHITPAERTNWNDTYNAVLYLIDLDNIETAYYNVFTSMLDPTAMTLADIEEAIATEWNGESSEDETAMSAEEIEEAISTEWNGESSKDETALSAEEISSVID